MISRFVIVMIVFYQKVLSPLIGPSCRFFPSCSSYTIQAIEKYGLGRGVLLGICRIGKCHPWHPGGFDPVK